MTYGRKNVTYGRKNVTCGRKKRYVRKVNRYVRKEYSFQITELTKSVHQGVRLTCLTMVELRAIGFDKCVLSMFCTSGIPWCRRSRMYTQISLFCFLYTGCMRLHTFFKYVFFKFVFFMFCVIIINDL